MKWYLQAFTKYFDFRGRSRRKELWSFIGIHLLVSILLYFIDLSLDLTAYRYGHGPAETKVGVLYLIYYLLTIIPTLALQVRRLHDVGKSGWLLVWSIVIPATLTILAFAIISSNSHPASNGFALLIIPLLIFLGFSIYIFVLFCTNSQDGPNKYGRNPKGKESEQNAPQTVKETPIHTSISTKKTMSSNQQNPDPTSDFLFNNCVQLINNGNYLEAEKLLDKALKIEPENIDYKKLKLLIEDQIAEKRELYNLYSKADEARENKKFALAESLINDLLAKDNNTNNIELRDLILQEKVLHEDYEKALQQIELNTRNKNFKTAESALQSMLMKFQIDDVTEKLQITIQQGRANEELNLYQLYHQKKDNSKALIHLSNYCTYQTEDREKQQILEQLKTSYNKRNNLRISLIVIGSILLIVGLIAVYKWNSKRKIEKDDYTSVIKSQQRKTLKIFITTYPESSYLPEVQSLLHTLNQQDSVKWLTAKEQNTTKAYKEYIQTTEEPLFYKEAATKHDSCLWASALLDPSEDTIITASQNLYTAQYRKQAAQKLEELQALTVTTGEIQYIQEVISNYFSRLTNKNFIGLADLFSPKTESYLRNRNFSKGDIISFHNKASSSDFEEFKADYTNMKTQRKGDRIEIKLYVDYYSTTDYPPEKFYESREYTVAFNSQNQIISVDLLLLSRTKIQ